VEEAYQWADKLAAEEISPKHLDDAIRVVEQERRKQKREEEWPKEQPRSREPQPVYPSPPQFMGNYGGPSPPMFAPPAVMSPSYPRHPCPGPAFRVPVLAAPRWATSKSTARIS